MKKDIPRFQVKRDVPLKIRLKYPKGLKTQIISLADKTTDFINSYFKNFIMFALEKLR